jgi:hypothetical protein
MESIMTYYGFSPFINDNSGYFGGNRISSVSIKEDLYLVLAETIEGQFKLVFCQFSNRDSIGKEFPAAANELISNFEKDLKEHREIIQKYLDYN